MAKEDDSRIQQEIEEYKNRVSIKDERDLLREANLLKKEFDSLIQNESNEITKRFFYIYGKQNQREGGLFDEIELGLQSYHLQRIKEVRLMTSYLKESQDLEFHRNTLIKIQSRYIHLLLSLIDLATGRLPMNFEEAKEPKKQTELPEQEIPLSPRQKEIMYELYKAKDRLGAPTISERTNISQSAVEDDLRRFKKEGLIERTESGAQLTREGLYIVKQIIQEKRFMDES